MKYLFFVVMIFFTVNVFAQQDKVSENLGLILNSTEANEELLVWIFFTDKGNDVDFYLNNPSEVVSEKSLERRRKILSEDKLIDLTDLPVNQNYINDLTNRGFKVKQRSKWLNGVSGYVTKSDLVQIVNLQSVKKADIVHFYKSSRIQEEKIEIKNPVEGSLQPEGITSFDYGSSFTQVNQINVPIAHDSGYTGSGVTICVMDAGFNNLPHEVFQNMNIIAAWDFVNGDPGVGDSSDMGYGGHGTNTLSIIGGFKEGELIGPAFDADFILAKTENTDSEMPVEEDNWIAALEWADSIGVDVTSTSLSYLEFDPPFPSYTWEDMDGNTMRITIAADLGVSKGIVIVNSASNEGFHPSHNTLWGPADGDSVFSIGAVDAGGNRASFSSVGPTADGRIKPDVMAMGTGVKMATSWNSSSYTNNGSGTSFSCPLVAGAVALVIQKNPNLSPLEVMESLRLTASQFSNPDRLMGWGIIDTWEAMNFITTGITDPDTNPEDFTLLTNYPNPFNPGTKISWQSPVGSHQILKVYDVLGNEVATLVDEYKPAGNYEIDFNASGLSSGIYIVTLRTDKSFVSHKICLLK